MKTIYGGEPKNPPAYCKFHHGYVTVSEMKRHECLKKQCGHLVKYDHPYWAQREETRRLRKERKNHYKALIG